MKEKLLDVIFAEDINSVKELLEEGIDPNFVDKNGDTPLLIAVETLNYDLVRLLLSHNADPNLLSRVPILHAAIDTAVEATKNNDDVYKDSTEIIELLLEYGADASLTDESGETAFEFAKDYHLPAQNILKGK